MERTEHKAGLTTSILRGSAMAWFIAAVVGQWIFVSYIVAFYWGAALFGDLKEWDAVLAYGYVPGETMDNLALGGHLLFAAIIHVAGPLQFVQPIRGRFPAFHRWTGRTFIATAFILSLTGLYMNVTGHAPGDLSQQIAISINGIAILVFGAIALRYAIAHDFINHRRFALRLFLCVCGVWFFRVGLMLSILLNGGPFGFDPQTFEGWFLTTLAYAQFLLPLAILEIYFWVTDHPKVLTNSAMALVLLLLTVGMGAGIYAATINMWLPMMY